MENSYLPNVRPLHLLHRLERIALCLQSCAEPNSSKQRGTTAPHWGQDCSKERPIHAQDWVWTWPVCTLIAIWSCNKCHPSCCHWKTVLPQASDTYPCRFTRSNASSSWIARPKPCHAAIGWHQRKKTWHLLAFVLLYITVYYYHTIYIWYKYLAKKCNALGHVTPKWIWVSIRGMNQESIDFPPKRGGLPNLPQSGAWGLGHPSCIDHVKGQHCPDTLSNGKACASQ